MILDQKLTRNHRTFGAVTDKSNIFFCAVIDRLLRKPGDKSIRHIRGYLNIWSNLGYNMQGRSAAVERKPLREHCAKN